MEKIKSFILFTFFLVVTVSVDAQKRFEHNVFASAGLFIDHSRYDNCTGLSVRLGYGLNYYFTDHISVMPAVAVRNVSENTFSDSEEGADDDFFTFLDIPIILQYHFSGKGDGWVVGFGPVFSFALDRDKYYLDAIPQSPLDGQSKIKTFHLGLQPGILYQTGKFRVGIESNIGLQNIENRHGLSSGSKYIHDIVASVYFHF